eukprot:g48685.t1
MAHVLDVRGRVASRRLHCCWVKDVAPTADRADKNANARVFGLATTLTLIAGVPMYYDPAHRCVQEKPGEEFEQS